MDIKFTEKHLGKKAIWSKVLVVEYGSTEVVAKFKHSGDAWSFAQHVCKAMSESGSDRITEVIIYW